MRAPCLPTKRKAQSGHISQAMKHSTMQKTNAKASETPEQTLNRQETDKVRKTRKRASSETSEQTLNRQDTDKTRQRASSETSEQTLNRQDTDKTHNRASETSEQTLNRQDTDKSRNRASETSEQTLNRQETDKEGLSVVPGFAFVLAKIVALDKDVGAVPIVVVSTLRCSVHIYVCANVGNVRGYRRYVDMYTSAYQRHSPTVGLHAEGLALQCLSFFRENPNLCFYPLYLLVANRIL